MKVPIFTKSTVQKMTQAPATTLHFSTQSALDEHISLLHEGKSKNTFECDHCHNFYSSKSSLKKHIMRNCAKKDMDQHIIVHERIKCPFCPEKFAKHPDMYKHISSVHAIKCQLCTAKLFTKKDMDEHITNYHKMPILSYKFDAK